MAALPALDQLPARDDEGCWRAVVEAPAGTRNKLKWQPALGVLELHAVLPLGTAFPYDFGFVPSTRGEDGDPLDVLLFLDEPVPPGTVVACRMLGVILARQKAAGVPVRRNDRLLAVGRASHRYGHWKKLADIPPAVLDEVERFFAFYNAQKGVRFEVLGRGGPAEARRLLQGGLRAAAGH
ncbi:MULTISPECIES: inorganic diphosphatase [Ramlibacter]|uniref:inorganic diphosphatase n=1 Tax=Ramlibacter pinisoli TaxID=2682844 RepID=A0A6N8IWD2_9BURK|nr:MULTISPECIES: inorganic diphosphatase [Ramlibacter]MBA2965444.1 inorganic diphosphatase [Ramlibacter sp. CGMCC 1.13660]MVQ30410.1 inorganic diphosphatase [Ramlibacter pinisoli]